MPVHVKDFSTTLADIRQRNNLLLDILFLLFELQISIRAVWGTIEERMTCAGPRQHLPPVAPVHASSFLKTGSSAKNMLVVSVSSSKMSTADPCSSLPFTCLIFVSAGTSTSP
jgi:hypothetical protein